MKKDKAEKELKLATNSLKKDSTTEDQDDTVKENANEDGDNSETKWSFRFFTFPSQKKDEKKLETEDEVDTDKGLKFRK